MTSARIDILSGRIGLDDAFARMPFRFGNVTVRAAVTATLELDLLVDGKPAQGYASEILAYKWFDKRPEKSAQENVTDLLGLLQDAVRRAISFPAADAFSLWSALDADMRDAAITAGHNALMAGYGTSMIERAVLDGLGRARGQSLWEIMQDLSTGFAAANLFPELAGMALTDVLPSAPLTQVAIRHTVGLLDPIDADDLSQDQRLSDGFPETLEDYLTVGGVRFLKVKVSGDAQTDLARLQRIASVFNRLGIAPKLTLDGNEQFTSIDAFAGFIDLLRSLVELEPIFANTLFIEQPVARDGALSSPLDKKALSTIGVPLLIDESDDRPQAFQQAIAHGYLGVSHKNCKGVFRSFMNAMLARHYSRQDRRCFLSAEDLSCLPVAGLNADLAVVAALGISHAEKNGHHFFGGMAHLPAAEIATAVADHPDLYRSHARTGGQVIADNGLLHLASLQRPGMGFAPPDLNLRTDPDDWSFDRLTQKN